LRGGANGWECGAWYGPVRCSGSRPSLPGRERKKLQRRPRSKSIPVVVFRNALGTSQVSSRRCVIRTGAVLRSPPTHRDKAAMNGAQSFWLGCDSRPATIWIPVLFQNLCALMIAVKSLPLQRAGSGPRQDGACRERPGRRRRSSSIRYLSPASKLQRPQRRKFQPRKCRARRF